VSSAGPNRGTTFTVTLPDLASRQAEHSTALVPVSMPRLDGVSVLAVDDNADSLDIAACALGAAGADVRTSSSGAEALEEWGRRPADVLVCDLAMPRMDGFDLLRRIRDVDRANGRATRAVAVTAYASDDYRASCAAAGFDAHVAKPYNTLEFVRAVAGAAART
jgi:CheY-like chemotaxis protein